MRIVQLTLIIGLLLFVQLDMREVWACSGPSFTIEEILPNTEYTIKAQVVEIDDAAQNGILQVETYITGGPGPEHLLISLTDPDFIYSKRNNSYHFGCSYLARPLEVGQNIYMFVARSPDGSYHSVRGFNNEDYYVFSTPESTVPLSPDLNSHTYEITESQFLANILEISGDSPTTPSNGGFYPASAPLLIKTSAGTDYFLPLDGGEPVVLTSDNILSVLLRRFGVYGEYLTETSCFTIDCLRFSASGYDVSFPYDAESISVNGRQIIEGQYALVSPTRQLVAVLKGDALNIHSLYDLIEDDPSEEIPTYPIVGALSVRGDRSFDIVNSVMWSPDGRFLAYSDLDGLWLWDGLTPDSARLLIPTLGNRIPYARHFSSQGSYLAVTEDERRYTIDLISGRELGDGVISPDERLMLEFVASRQNDSNYFGLRMIQLFPFNDSLGFGVDTFDIHQAEWIDNRAYAVVSCTTDESSDCQVERLNARLYFQLNFEEPEPGYAFVLQHGDMAVIVDENTISINHQPINFSDALDGAIAEIRWLPSVFYYE